MSKDFVPKGIAQFNEWQDTLSTGVETNAEKWHIPAEDVDDLKKERSKWRQAYREAANPDTCTRAARMVRRKQQREYEKYLRRFIKAHLANNKYVTVKDKVNLGLHVPDGNPTPAPDIVTIPVIKIDLSYIQRHKLIVRDSEKLRAGKPEHAAGFEIWRKVGSEPLNDNDWTLVTLAFHSPHVLSYDFSQSGTRVYYRLRWVNTRGVPGPWSEVVSAIIP
jgi:hypothetical protein